jgi:beta-ureidopropionase / N-carbamoyl-L-amino-acid hydrolase
VLIDPERLWSSIMEMAEVGGIPGGGCRRLSLSPEDGAGRDLFSRWCREAGCTVEVDCFGNMFAIRRGRAQPDRLVMTGSHLDTQPVGGRFDGIYGVMAGLEVMRTLNDLDLETACSVAVVNWTNEEGARFSAAQTGSKGFVGQVSLEQAYQLRGVDGVSFGEALDGIGYAGNRGPRPEQLVCYVEAHIEQGPVLEAARKTLGIVESAQAARWYQVDVNGETRHAGTTPAKRRRDAYMAAAAFAVQSRRHLLDMDPGIRFTIGRVELGTNAPNTVPGQASFTIDLRFPGDQVLDRAETVLRDVLSGIDRQEGTRSQLQTTHVVPMVGFDAALTTEIETLAGSNAMRLSSGAMHDACAIAAVAPTAMIFVPSRDGVSHHQDEWLEPRDAASGADLLFRVVEKKANPVL